MLRFGTLVLAVYAAWTSPLASERQVLTFRTRAWLSFAPPTCRMPPGQASGVSRADPGGRVTLRFRHRLIRFRHFCSGSLALASLNLACQDQVPTFPQRCRVGPGISPRAAHRSGLDTLASSGSCHRTKAAASRRELELLLLPVDSLPTSVTCPLRSTGITPLPRYYGAVRPYPPHRYFRPRSFAACTFSLGIAGQVLKFRTRARMRVMPPIHRAPRGQ